MPRRPDVGKGNRPALAKTVGDQVDLAKIATGDRECELLVCVHGYLRGVSLAGEIEVEHSCPPPRPLVAVDKGVAGNNAVHDGGGALEVGRVQRLSAEGLKSRRDAAFNLIPRGDRPQRSAGVFDSQTVV